MTPSVRFGPEADKPSPASLAERAGASQCRLLARSGHCALRRFLSLSRAVRGVHNEDNRRKPGVLPGTRSVCRVSWKLHGPLRGAYEAGKADSQSALDCLTRRIVWGKLLAYLARADLHGE